MEKNINNSNRTGFRGYICARMEMGRSTPQHIQQIVMRDYCAQRSMRYLLAAVEYCMPGCTMVLDSVLGEQIESLQGIVMYSLYLFPQSSEKRQAVYRRILEAGAELHMAAEGLVIRNWDDAMRIEENWLVHEAMQGQAKTDYTYLSQWDLEHATN
jgi:sporadic carbohydrate cluster protein (TIGR04323 family)